MAKAKPEEQCEHYSGSCGMQMECEDCPLWQDKELLGQDLPDQDMPNETTRGLFVHTAMCDIGLTEDEAERAFDEFAGSVDWG